ncbi:hypothetical protein QQF64_001493 [Cirrhinus molitorella]|uniref:ribonuclease H n=1 Tax=Cirrhinus molitorella TaxID=172907 RepID=A0ABR3P078_9TELE
MGTIHQRELLQPVHSLTSKPTEQIKITAASDRVRTRGRDYEMEAEASEKAAAAPYVMEELLKHLTEVSIRQQQIMEHLASRQGETERGLVELQAAQRAPPPDPRVQAAQLLPKMTGHDDAELFLQMFENVTAREAWARQDWVRLLAPLLTGEAQRAYFSLSPEHNESYDELKTEILSRVGLSPTAATQLFFDWEYNPRLPPRPQAAELSRLARHWLLFGDPTASQVAERVVIDRLLRALPRSHRQAVGMRNPTNLGELVEAVELADAAQRREAGERAPPFPRRVVQERRPLEGPPRPVSRPAAPAPPDEPMPTEPPRSRAWLAGCSVHRAPPGGAPRVEVRVNGHPFEAILDSGSTVSLVNPAVLAPRPDTKARLAITCVHGDTQEVAARRVTISAASGAWPIEVGIVKDLPVPVLLGRDWPGFDQLLRTASQPASPSGSRRRPSRQRGGRRRPVLLASDSARDDRTQLAALASSSPVVVDIDPQLSAAQKTELQHLVGQFSDVFSPWPGQTNVIQHDIQTPAGVIVRQRPYRIPEARRQAVEEEVQDMLKLGVIEPSRSPWSSPVVMVPKPDGTLRFCNDFRRLNEISEFDGYPMPRVDELLDRLGRARYISTLDLTKGYWQVPLTKEAKPKTAFSTPSGHWQYRTLPFGLHGAPATFQRMMDILLRPHQAYAAAYLDDVIIHSERWEDHLLRLGRVLGELRRAGLTANPRKCHLARTEAHYLGFQVGRGLIKPQERKVVAVQDAPRPATKTQVRAFLGLAGYYRCFIPNFSSLAAPLTDLTRKGQPEKALWGPAEEEAFQHIKKALTTEPVLRAPDFNCPFLLQTDASDTGLGAVLSQVLDGEEHPVIYISRKLTPAEQRYATVEREALAVKWAVLELRSRTAEQSSGALERKNKSLSLSSLAPSEQKKPLLLSWPGAIQPADQAE